MALQGQEREHIMLIEEAHRLLAGGHSEGVSSSWKYLAPQVGLEPTTLRLTAGC
jgi:hypothetical protein